MKRPVERLFMDLCMELWSGDANISYELFIKTINETISNIESHIGEAAHRRLESLGVEDNTGMTWEEQDEQAREQIKEYQDLLDYLKTDSNWTI